MIESLLDKSMPSFSDPMSDPLTEQVNTLSSFYFLISTVQRYGEKGVEEYEEESLRKFSSSFNTDTNISKLAML